MTPGQKAEARIAELGISDPRDIDIEAIAFDAGIRVEYDQLRGCATVTTARGRCVPASIAPSICRAHATASALLENVLLVDFSPTRRTCARQRPRCLMIVDMLPPLRAPDVQNACTVPCICARECAAACSKPASGKAANPARVAPFLEVR